jgi:putative transposase
MPRRLRWSDVGYVYHVLNGAVRRATLFRNAADYEAFEKILRQGWELLGMGVLSFVLMPNHLHLVVQPEQDGALCSYLQWISVTHVRRWNAHYHTSGTGPLFQRHFKAFPIQQDEHLLSVLR